MEAAEGRWKIKKASLEEEETLQFPLFHILCPGAPSALSLSLVLVLSFLVYSPKLALAMLSLSLSLSPKSKQKGNKKEEKKATNLSLPLSYAFISLPAISALGLGSSPKSGTNPTLRAISASVLHSFDSGEHAPSV